MRKVILYIAMSLDGYIADRRGGVDWLNGHSDDEETVDTYSAFLKGIDTVVMGWNTYHQITTELSPGKWVYQELTSYVITHRQAPPADNIRFVQEDPCSLVRKLKLQQGKAIWVCGGGMVIHPLLQSGLIDQYQISVIPTILGSGIRLFGEVEGERKLKLLHAQSYNGITELIYVPR